MTNLVRCLIESEVSVNIMPGVHLFARTSQEGQLRLVFVQFVLKYFHSLGIYEKRQSSRLNLPIK